MKINPVTLAPNIARAYEIALLGEHTMSIFPDISDSMAPNEALQLTENVAFFVSSYKAAGANIKEGKIADIVVGLPPVSEHDLLSGITNSGETIMDIEQRVRYEKTMGRNPELIISGAIKSLLKTAIDRLELSIRQFESILKVSVTIAKLDKSETVKVEHIAEAIQYQSHNI